MDVVPEDLAELIHRAARATAPYPADLAALRRRARARRRRRTTTAVAGLVVLVALTGGGVPLLVGGQRPATPPAAPPPSPSPSPTAPSTPPTPAPAQRLLLSGDGGTVRPHRGGPEIGLVGGVADELRSDGSVVRHRVPAGWQETVALPDGRLVGLKFTDLMPGVRRTDGPDVAGLSVKLMLLRADGRVEVDREVRIRGQALALAGADARYAYLVRDGVGLVSHELTTGREKTLIRVQTKVDGELPFRDADVTAGRVVSVTGPADLTQCRLDVRRLAGGSRLSRLTVAGDCAPSVRLSPGGGLVAVPYRRPNGRNLDYRLAILDTATGQLRADQPLGTASPTYGLPGGGTWGAAWIDDTTVRVVWAHLPDPPRKVYSVAELARVVTVSVQ
ncbi:hypothetical protein GCE86_22755 [Micromonospora terminaliae]|uniref:Uncharacterized protein n=1 Tax=Micromonospora terminaliae TaxID=1914461 RepID=A0AAJ3DLA5_9ACTN|nr:hypothetical protein [Micromonospora terminaliae]NES30586.1 hypothetical protein [Micromonospora terminaliae]QGL49596.1 hypothetical protein GCE86_22755 [Micromonospora terminaliae]